MTTYAEEQLTRLVQNTTGKPGWHPAHGNRQTIIAIEGIDGAGKTTLAKNAAKLHPDACYLHFPTSTPPKTYRPEWYLADMACAIHKALDDYQLIITDRYLASTIVYGSITLGYSLGRMKRWVEPRRILLDLPHADCTMILPTTPQQAAQQIKNRPGNTKNDLDLKLQQDAYQHYMTPDLVPNTLILPG